MAGDIGSASVRITPNMTGIQSKIAAGFKGSAGPATAALGKEVEDNAGPFQGALGKLGGIAKAGGIAIAAGMAAGAAGLVALTGKALMAGAELEQQLGGAEAVFGEYADGIKEKAKDAYFQAGLSQNEFLQGANKMGSLFQGAGFTVQQSMQMSAESMQRASDIASIMGIDTTAALEAVTGMAKGNFTMMDNLGVAMNDTAIGAYALSKGINKTTSEMSIQEKVGLAQQMFMEKTAKYAGNYAKENQTLAGSLNSTKKAFDNLMSGQGDINGFIELLVNTIQIAVPQIIKILPNIVTGIGAVLKAIVPAIAQALPTLVPALITAVVDLVAALVEAMPTVIKVLLEALPMLIDGFIQLFLAIVKALPTIVTNIANALPTIINAIVTGLTNPEALQAIIMGAVQLLIAIIQAIPIIVNALVDALPVIIENILAVLTDPVFIKAMIAAGVELLKALIGGIASMVKNLVVALWDVIRTIADVLKPDNMHNIGKSIVEGLWQGIQSLNNWLRDKVINFVKDKIPGAIKDALGIHSPSKVAAALGVEVPRGLAEGIYKGSNQVERAALNMANSALSGMTANAMTPTLNGNINTPTPYGTPAAPTQATGAPLVEQHNDIYNQVDLDKVSRELAWQLRR